MDGIWALLRYVSEYIKRFLRTSLQFVVELSKVVQKMGRVWLLDKITFDNLRERNERYAHFLESVDKPLFVAPRLDRGSIKWRLNAADGYRGQAAVRRKRGFSTVSKKLGISFACSL